MVAMDDLLAALPQSDLELEVVDDSDQRIPQIRNLEFVQESVEDISYPMIGELISKAHKSHLKALWNGFDQHGRVNVIAYVVQKNIQELWSRNAEIDEELPQVVAGLFFAKRYGLLHLLEFRYDECQCFLVVAHSFVEERGLLDQSLLFTEVEGIL